MNKRKNFGRLPLLCSVLFWLIGMQDLHAEQLINSHAVTTVNLNSEVYDTDNMHSTDTNNSRITFPVTGKYRVTGQVTFEDAGDNTNRAAQLRVNGTTYLAAVSGPAVNGIQTQLLVAAEGLFSAGDYIELQVYQDSGSAIYLNSHGEYTPSLSAAKMF